MDISVVICTFDRLESLSRALRSCLQQDVPDSLAFEIIVVGNSPEGNARDAVEQIATAQVTMTYVHEPRSNISHARNAGVAAAAGRLIAFMDDDMAAPRDWLRHAREVIKATDADVLIGKVEPEFEDDKGWGQKLAKPAEWFGRDIDISEGAVLTDLRRTGTGNCLLRRALVVDQSEPFDPAFGRLGGEGTDFLQRLQQTGVKIVFSHKAWMTEFVPTSRSTAEYLALRRYRESQQFVRLVVKNRAQIKWATAGRHMATGLVQFVMAAMQYATARLRGMDQGLPRVAMAQALGKMFWIQNRDGLQPYR